MPGAPIARPAVPEYSPSHNQDVSELTELIRKKDLENEKLRTQLSEMQQNSDFPNFSTAKKVSTIRIQDQVRELQDQVKQLTEENNYLKTQLR